MFYSGLTKRDAWDENRLPYIVSQSVCTNYKRTRLYRLLADLVLEPVVTQAVEQARAPEGRARGHDAAAVQINISD